MLRFLHMPLQKSVKKILNFCSPLSPHPPLTPPPRKIFSGLKYEKSASRWHHLTNHSLASSFCIVIALRWYGYIDTYISISLIWVGLYAYLSSDMISEFRYRYPCSDMISEFRYRYPSSDMISDVGYTYRMSDIHIRCQIYISDVGYTYLIDQVILSQMAPHSHQGTFN